MSHLSVVLDNDMTTADVISHVSMYWTGGKGLFTKELDEALLDGRVDIAVHSMKDVPTELPDGITIPINLQREDVRDAFISRKFSSLNELSPGSVLGTSSLRRQTQIVSRLDGVKAIQFRGNVQTRLRKLDEEQVDATMLAFAGLRRLGLESEVTALVEPDEVVPACSQGAIGIALRQNDEQTHAALSPLNDMECHIAVTCERAFLHRLGGSCTTPVGGHARRVGISDTLRFDGVLARLEWNGPGPSAIRTNAEGQFSMEGAVDVGTRAAEDLLSKVPAGFLEGLLAE